jgi:dienelactone hydrolase
MTLDTVSARWERLKPHIQVFGPDDSCPRPAVLLFHGCGGVREHMTRYAVLAADIGWRAFVVDSFAHRGWSRLYAMCMVCTGLRMRGGQRAGDILAALRGVGQRADVDSSSIVLAGWSHGSWSIMDLMTFEDDRKGLAGLADPDMALRDRVAGLFLVYPFVGSIVRTRRKPWRHRPPTFGLIAARDHISSAAQARAVYASLARQDVPLETWVAQGSHAFDEPGATAPMTFDPELTRQAEAHWTRFLTRIGRKEFV